jgi:hypothetical protein
MSKTEQFLAATFWWFAIVFTVAFWVVFAVLMSKAFAHMAAATPQQPQGWQYGWECCSMNDCAQVRKTAVTEGADGVTVHLEPGDHPMILWAVTYTIPYGDKRLKYESKDGLYHVCHKRQFVKPDGSINVGDVICVYLPPRGF